MSKNTFFNTRFWQDSYVSDLDPSEKLLFVYSITSPALGLTGIYEIPIKNIALETGIDKEMILKIFKRLEQDKKVIYKNGWLCVVNYPKYQRFSGDKLLIAVEREIKAIPSDILKFFIKNKYPIDTLSIPSMDMDRDMDKETDEKKVKNNDMSSFKNMRRYKGEEGGYDEVAVQTDPDHKPKGKAKKKVSDDIQAVFDLFTNPAKAIWRLREIERESAQVLFDTYGLDKLKIRLDRIEKEKGNKDPLFPLVVTPSQLLDKMPNVERYLNI